MINLDHKVILGQIRARFSELLLISATPEKVSYIKNRNILKVKWDDLFGN